MSDADLSQYDIDRLLETINSEPSETAIDDAEERRLYDEQHKNLGKQLASAIKRYDFALQNNEPHHVIRELREALHYYAFKNWLMSKKMDKEQYYTLIRKEMKKRGMR